MHIQEQLLNQMTTLSNNDQIYQQQNFNVKFLLFVILLIASPVIISLDINLQHVDSRCSNGTHKSPDGYCEKVGSGNDPLKDTHDYKTFKKINNNNRYDKNLNSNSNEKNDAGSINTNSLPP
jgi:hypothetical protein